MEWNNILTDYYFYQFCFVLCCFAGVILKCRPIKSQYIYISLSAPSVIGTIVGLFWEMPYTWRTEGALGLLIFIFKLFPQIVVLSIVAIYQLAMLPDVRVIVWSLRTSVYILIMVIINLSILIWALMLKAL